MRIKSYLLQGLACFMIGTLLVAGLMFTPTECLGQVTTATFYGVLTDPTGAVIPAATVTMTHERTGASTTKTTDQAGEFAFEFLRVGTYTLNIQAQGFKTYEATGIELTAAQKVRRTFVLELGAVTEVVEVVGETPQINTVAADQRENLNEMKLENLPMSRRSFNQLLSVGTGIITTGEGGVRMNGIGRAGLKVTVDGTDATSNPENPGTSMYQNFNYIHVMSIEAIQEVQVTKGVTPAEYGQQLSGNVNLISKSGTNEWHGSLFESFKAEDLNAKDTRRGDRPPMTFNQFGGSVGGPIQKNKIFIFGTYEGYREASFGTVDGDVPTQRLRDEAIAAQPEYADFLNTLYLPTRDIIRSDGTVDPDVGRIVTSAGGTRSENHATIKGDIQVTSLSHVSLTYARSRPNRFSPQGRTQIGNGRLWKGVSERGTATYLIGGAAWTSETRFGYNYNQISRVDQSWDFPHPPEDTEGGRRAPCLNVYGLFGNGGGSELVEYYGPVWSIEEKFAKNAGRHSLKFGGIFSRRQPSRFDIENNYVTYRNKADFLANIPHRIQATYGVNRYVGRSWEIGFFTQDDWRIRHNLVINLGVRWDGFSKFVAKPTDERAPAYLWNLDGLLDNQFNFGPLRDKLDPFESDWGANIGPRVGFSYNPHGNAKNVIRGGLSVMFAPMPWDTMNNAVATSPTLPFRYRFSRAECAEFGLRFPSYNDDSRKFIEGSDRMAFSDLFQPDLQAAYTVNYYLGIQHELSPTLMIESAFVSDQGRKFRQYRQYNLVNRVTGIRPNPNLGEGNYISSDQNVFYASWQTSLRKRYSRNLMFDIHYTWGKSLSYTGGDNGAGFSGDQIGTIQDFFNWKNARGPSSDDITHRLVADYIYDLPTFADQGAVRHLIGGWQISGIFTAQTGTPVNIGQSGDGPQRADYIGGKPIMSNWKKTGQYLNVDAFAKVPVSEASGNPIRPGNIGNGRIRRPGWWNLNFSFGKKFSITEGMEFRLRADMFNVFNYTPYSGFRTNISGSNFGRFTSHRPEREIQLNARLTW